MADYATLLPVLKKKYNAEDSRVIVFGGANLLQARLLRLGCALAVPETNPRSFFLPPAPAALPPCPHQARTAACWRPGSGSSTPTPSSAPLPPLPLSAPLTACPPSTTPTPTGRWSRATHRPTRARRPRASTTSAAPGRSCSSSPRQRCRRGFGRRWGVLVPLSVTRAAHPAVLLFTITRTAWPR